MSPRPALETNSRVIPFPAAAMNRPRPAPVVDLLAMGQLGHAEDHCEAILGDVKTASHNAADGTPLAGLGGIRDGRTLSWACRLILSLVNLRGNPERDHALTHAARQWLQAREVRS